MPPALHRLRTLRFHHIDGDRLIAYSRTGPATGDMVLCVVSLDPDVPRRGTLVLAPGDLGISARSVDLVDEVSGEALTWSQTLPVHLDPGRDVAAIYTSPAPPPLRSTCEH
ncbi:hypothetical protein [Salinispora mooreana]|uniref:hypothetical protein n=1 Tax=Salinispora mooreana TaxID=999545 RepID=UPI000382697C|nr:hypothetical protein [Salinispora mooreana]